MLAPDIDSMDVTYQDLDSENSGRGEETGIGMSAVPIGGGVNAENIRKVLNYMKERNFDGDISIECDGSDENIRKSVEWIRGVLAE